MRDRSNPHVVTAPPTAPGPMPEPPKLVIFNVKYSPNLGDGVIAECLEHALRGNIPGAHIVTLDLAGRTGWSVPAAAAPRLRRLALLRRMPGWMRDVAVGAALAFLLRFVLRRTWRRELADADLAIFGGGQLIQDSDLNFPLKLAGAADECRRLALPIAIYAVGAAPSRSPRGRRLLQRLLQAPRLMHVAARDPQSAEELHKLGSDAVVLCRDPGLLAARLWPVRTRPARARPLVGLGITHAALLRHHAHHDVIDGDIALADLYVELVGDLVSAGYDVVCFSNGAAEDEALLAVLRGRFAQSSLPGSHVRTAPRSGTPRGLAALIAGFDAVIAHRLHACVLAYSYRIPHLGLTWDRKLQAFFATVHRAKYAVPLHATTRTTIVRLLQEACREGIDATVHARVLSETAQAIRHLSDALVGALGNRTMRPMALAAGSFARGSP